MEAARVLEQGRPLDRIGQHQHRGAVPLVALADLLAAAVVGEHLGRVERRSAVGDLLRGVRQRQRDRPEASEHGIVVVEHQRVGHGATLDE